MYADWLSPRKNRRLYNRLATTVPDNYKSVIEHIT